MKGFDSLSSKGGTSHQFVKPSHASSVLEKVDEKQTSEDFNLSLQFGKCEIVERYSRFGCGELFLGNARPRATFGGLFD